MNAKDVMLARTLGSGGGSGYTLPVASPTRLGGVKPEAATDEMSQPVGVDAAGKLWTELGGGGADGKSAYQYAVEGGYTGTEAEFATKMAEEIPDKLPNPHALTFTGAVSGSYDGSAALTVNIPEGGGGTGGGGVTPELLCEVTAENVSNISQEIDWKGHTNFYIIIGGTKGETAINIMDATLLRSNTQFEFGYYTSFLDATNTSYPDGSVVHELRLLSDNFATVSYLKYTTNIEGCTGDGSFQGNSSAVPNPKVSGLFGYAKTRNDGVYISFSAPVSSVRLTVYGF